jgi:transcriptional regulator
MHIDLLQGTLDMLILKALTAGPMHGYGVARWLERATDDALRVEEGSLYPALHRLEEARWIKARWATTEAGRRARMYEITAAGRAQLESQEARWKTITGAVGKVLKLA